MRREILCCTIYTMSIGSRTYYIINYCQRITKNIAAQQVTDVNVTYVRLVFTTTVGANREL